MKKIKNVSFDYSPLSLRRLTRHKIAPPTTFFVDRKKQSKKSACRINKKLDYI
jgi:hypothetical protein